MNDDWAEYVWAEGDISPGRKIPDPSEPPASSSPLLAPDDLVLRHVHGEPLLRRLGRGMTRPFLAVGDLQALTEKGRWIQHPVTTGLRIAVTGSHGGAGGSTIAALLAATFARHRQDRVLALDLDPVFGSLPLRLGVPDGRSLADLAHAGLGTASFQEVEPYLARSGERLWALPGWPGQVCESAGDGTAVYRSAGLSLSRFFGVTIIDCGTELQADTLRAVLASAHAHVFVAPATTSGAKGVSRAHTRLRQLDLIQRTVVVFTVRTRHGRPSPEVASVRQALRRAGSDAMVLGFDRHLAVGTTIAPRRLAYPTRIATIDLAANVIRRALPPAVTPPSA